MTTLDDGRELYQLRQSGVPIEEVNAENNAGVVAERLVVTAVQNCSFFFWCESGTGILAYGRENGPVSLSAHVVTALYRIHLLSCNLSFGSQNDIPI